MDENWREQIQISQIWNIWPKGAKEKDENWGSGNKADENEGNIKGKPEMTQAIQRS